MNKYKHEMKNRLVYINDHLKEFDANLELTIVGGAAFILSNLVDRTTIDIDYINKVNSNVIGMLVRKGFDINDHAKIFDYQFGENWDRDTLEILNLSNLRVCTLSKERLMVGRLFSSRRSDDFASSYKNAEINQDKFEDIFLEVYPAAIDMERKSFTENIYMIEEMYKYKGWDYENSNIKNLY